MQIVSTKTLYGKANVFTSDSHMYKFTSTDIVLRLNVASTVIMQQHKVMYINKTGICNHWTGLLELVSCPDRTSHEITIC